VGPPSWSSRKPRQKPGLAGGQLIDLCLVDAYDFGGYNVQASWSNAEEACRHVALTPPPHEMQITLSNVNFHTTGFNVTPLAFSASEGMPYASTDPTTLCAADETNNTPGSCTCPATSASNDECRRALNVCFSGSNVGAVGACSRQEIAADVSAVVVPVP